MWESSEQLLGRDKHEAPESERRDLRISSQGHFIKKINTQRGKKILLHVCPGTAEHFLQAELDVCRLIVISVIIKFSPLSKSRGENNC